MRKLKPAYLFMILSIPHLYGFAQDSLRKKIKFTVSENIWIQKNFDGYSPVSMPSEIKSIRKNATKLPTQFDSLTDNPLSHGATYMSIKSATTFKDKLTLYFDLYAEQRGSSYGLFNKNNLLLYPVFYIEVKDSIQISKTLLLLHGKAGMFLNEKLDEGLSIYNVDAQGIKLTIQKNKWLMESTVYADFYGGIGLNIDDIYSVSFKRKLGLNDSSEAGISFNYNKQFDRFTPLKTNLLFNIFGHKNFKHSKIYAQAGLRPGNDFIFLASNSFTEKIAGLLGVEYNYSRKGFEFNTAVEARYYGSIYNEGYYNFNLRYRKPATDIYEMYANTVGAYLYPLRKFSTPFSQWAVFTEYYFSNTFSLSLCGNIKTGLGKKTSAGLMYDFNFIRAKDNFNNPDHYPVSSFLYPFFTASLSYNIIKEVETSLLLTNQSMNLDVSYPTFYLLSHPRFGFSLKTSF